MLLEVKNVTVLYGKSVAVEDVSLCVREGEAVGIIGANGAGKSTILKVLSRLWPLTSGEIWFAGDRIDRKETTEVVRLGISFVPEGRQLFPYLSVLINLKLGASARGAKKCVENDLEEVYTLFPRLRERRHQEAGTLSGGEQQMVAIARALMARPRLLCMDEPSLGLAPVVVKQVGEAISKINTAGVSVLLVEQNIQLAFGIARRVYALQVGKVVREGGIAAITADDFIRKAYLGA